MSSSTFHGSQLGSRFSGAFGKHFWPNWGSNRPWQKRIDLGTIHRERWDEESSELDAFCREVYGLLPHGGRASRKGILTLFNAIVSKKKEYQNASRSELIAQSEILKSDVIIRGFQRANVTELLSILGLCAKRTLGLEAHPVQYFAASQLLRGRVVEMATGEGKSLTAALAAAAAVHCGRRVHIVTVNDYLASRDAEEFKTFFNEIGLTCSAVVAAQSREERFDAYRAHVLYVKNSTLAFDYLRDLHEAKARQELSGPDGDPNASSGASEPMVPELSIAIVDEIDAVLVDEARMPLILSETSASDLNETLLKKAIEFGRKLQQGREFVIDQKRRVVEITNAGLVRVNAEAAAWAPLVRAQSDGIDLMKSVITALHLYKKDEHFVVKDKKVILVEESTGRLLDDRKWERGIQQCIERIEGCEPSGENNRVAETTYKRVFSKYKWVSGLSGTVSEISAALSRDYGLASCAVPTHRPTRRIRERPRCFRSKSEKWAEVARVARSRAVLGQPVLIGTRTVAASQQMSEALRTLGVEHAILNAQQNAKEAELIGQVGRTNSVTIATNMAGRGTDIKLCDAARSAGGLHVILTEYHESARVDRQLEGRSGRQGDPGSFQAIVSLEDDIFERFLEPWVLLSASQMCANGELRWATIVETMRRVAQFRAGLVSRAQRNASNKAVKSSRKALAFVQRID